jgi:hypothetical protein
MPLAVSYLLTLPLVLGRKTIGFQDTQRGILLSNPAILAPEGTKPAVVALLGSLDFFTLWTLVLLALGYRAVAKVSGTAATATVLVLWLLFVGIKVGIAAVFG